jgi:hypothetical protein
VRWAARSWLWSLVALVLFGLVLMHHTVGYPRQHAESIPPPAAATGPAVAMGEQQVANCSCPGPDHGAPVPGDNGQSHSTELLHLCLAILAALGGLLAVGLRLRWTVFPASGGAAPGQPAGPETLRPALPVPRRLAVLGVLRL